MLVMTAALLSLGITAHAAPVKAPEDGHAFNPTWSPSGEWVSFELNRQTSNIDLFFQPVGGIEPTGSPEKVELPGKGCGSFGACDRVVINPDWHPSQRMVVYEGTNGGGEYRLYFSSPGGAGAAEMVATSVAPGNLTFPDVSPDGRSLLFVSGASGSGDVASWSSSTGQVTMRTSDPQSEMFPQFHADGTRVVFTRKRNESEDVFLLDGADARVIGEGEGDQTRPTWAAGDRVLYFSQNAAQWDIKEWNAGKTRTLASGVRLPLRARPAISPDGRWLAYTYDDPTKSGYVEIQHLETQKVVRVDTPHVACGEPALTTRDGATLLAYTALPQSDSAWRFLALEDISAKLK